MANKKNKDIEKARLEASLILPWHVMLLESADHFDPLYNEYIKIQR